MTPDLRPALPAVEAGLELLAAPLTHYQITAAAAMSQPNRPGDGFAHTVVAILWPRQTGKTTLLACLALGRARRYPDFRAAYAAQTGHITSQRFKEWSDMLHRRPGWHLDYKTRDSDGTEKITVRANHSLFRAFPPIPGRLRSSALDLVIVDEAQEHDDAKVGQKLDADIQPTFDTRPRGQWIIAGTAGDVTATYWRRHYRNALAGEPGHLLLEIGTPPEGSDLEDPAVWAANHPGILAGRTTVEKLQQARATLGAERFQREYLNQWSEAAVESVFPPGAWRECLHPDSGIIGRPSLALEVTPDRDLAVIVGAGTSTLDPNLRHVELIEALPLSQAVHAAKRLTSKYRTPLTVDPMAPGVTHIDALNRARVPITIASSADVVTASLSLFDRVHDRTAAHLDQPQLTTGAAGATKRKLGNRWAFDRYAPGGAVIMAAALASHAADKTEGRDDTPALLTS